MAKKKKTTESRKAPAEITAEQMAVISNRAREALSHLQKAAEDMAEYRIGSMKFLGYASFYRGLASVESFASDASIAITNSVIPKPPNAKD